MGWDKAKRRRKSILRRWRVVPPDSSSSSVETVQPGGPSFHSANACGQRHGGNANKYDANSFLFDRVLSALASGRRKDLILALVASFFEFFGAEP